MVIDLRYYILDDDGIPKAVADVVEWGKWFQTAERRIAYYQRDGYWVSTVFIGINNNFGWRGPPVLFETMAFDDVREIRKSPAGRLYKSRGDEMTCERYSTKDDALIGHERIVKALNERLDAARDLAANFEKK